MLFLSVILNYSKNTLNINRYCYQFALICLVRFILYRLSALSIVDFSYACFALSGDLKGFLCLLIDIRILQRLKQKLKSLQLVVSYLVLLMVIGIYQNRILLDLLQ